MAQRESITFEQIFSCVSQQTKKMSLMSSMPGTALQIARRPAAASGAAAQAAGAESLGSANPQLQPVGCSLFLVFCGGGSPFKVNQPKKRMPILFSGSLPFFLFLGGWFPFERGGLIFGFGRDVGSTHSNWRGWGLEQCGGTNRKRMPFFPMATGHLRIELM